MSYRKILLAALTLLLLIPGVDVRSADQTLIAAGSAWKYNDSGSNLGTAWRALAYDDATWQAGLAPLGYGDGDESTVLSYGGNTSNRRITYYFRRGFNVADPASVAALTVRYVRDDGCVIYVNGVEVVRSNMPAGATTYTTRATAAIGGADESAWLEAPIDPALLVQGTNVVAVEIHQQSPTSTDVSFDLELRATEAQTTTPVVSLLAPANQTVTNAPEVTFSASVSAPAGLASATLYVGGPPQTVAFSGPVQMEDAQITADTPTTANADGAQLINVDGSPLAHGLMKFPLLVGGNGGQVPPGAIITSAQLQLTCTDAGSAMQLYRLTQDWKADEATWNERALGSAWASPGANGPGSHAGVPVIADCPTVGQRLVDLTQFVQEWSSGSPNYGVVFVASGTNGIDFSSSESANPPALTVSYKSSQQSIETRLLSGNSAEVSFSTVLPIGQTYYWNVEITDATGRQSRAPSDFELTVDASAPNALVLVSPADGSTGVATSPVLAAFVSDPAGGPLTVTATLRQPAAPEFTIIALPDTQHYAEAFPAIFTSQTQWIVNNTAARNIAFVTHEGDIVNQNNVISQWLVADASMSLLDGVVPYGMGPGNHDQPTTLYNQFFPYTRYQGQPWYGGHYQNLNDNNYQLFSGGGMDFVIVHLEYCPPAAVLSWASSVIQSYPDRIGMMTTHAYLGLGAVRSTHGCGNTQYIWDQLAVRTPNLHFMLSGHVHGESRRIDTVNGHPVFQMLADYQNYPSGGEGWLRILRFVPADDKIYVQTYSPWLNRFDTDADSEFALDFPMGGTVAGAGSTTVPSGSTASIPISGLAPSTRYEWQMTVTNGSGKSRTGPLWSFTTGSGGTANDPPIAQGQSVNAVEDTAAAITLTAFDQNDDQVTFTIVDGPSRGTLSGSSPTLIYHPAANFNGTDSFTFRANDGQLTSEPGTVSITVQTVNDPPVAAAESYVIQGGKTLTVTAPGVLGNDTDVDGTGLVAQLVASATRGTLTLSANGSMTYTPATGYSGPDSFVYRASDGQIGSAPATVSIAVLPEDTTAPAVTITAPSSGATVSGIVTVSANAYDNEAVLGVQFLLNGAPLGVEDTAPPYSVTWSSTGVADGSHQFAARARDAAGNQTTATAVTVTINNDTTAPAVTMTAPSPGATVSGIVTVSANASDNAGVVGVQFLLNGAPLGPEDTIAPYIVTWSSTGLADGSHQLSARARDAAGHQTTATAVTVNVNNDTIAPAVTITAPAPGATVSGNVTVSANASDNTRVTGVQFLLDGVPLGPEDTTAPYSVTWSSTGLADGSHQLSARARDAAGNQTTATAVTININNDTIAPAVTMTAPAPGATVSGNVTVSANASDNAGVLGVQFLLNGAPLGAEDTTAPYSVTWSSTGAADGSHQLSAQARDAAGNRGTATAVTVNVNNDTAAPAVTMTAPAPGATVSGVVTVSANALDNAGVLGVQFLLDGAPLGAEDTTAPYSVTWSSTGGADGSHQLSARARDAAGNQATAAAVTVNVYNTIPAATGLVASYSFNEGSGISLNDRTGKGHTGTISGATWTTQGKYGRALSFDGINDWVTVKDTADLDLTTGMTLEAWVRPSSLAAWRTVLLKQRSGGLTYSLYASNDNSVAEGDVNIDGDMGATAPETLPLNTWSHMAVTYDGTTVRLFVNGIEVGEPGGVWRDVGVDRSVANWRDSVWTEFFHGYIDEIRIDNRALTEAEILADMAAPINP